MQIKLALSEEESKTLGRHFHKSPIELIRLKSQAVIMKSKGFKVEEIAEALLKDSRSVIRWTSDFDKRRMSSIFSGLENNENASKLSKNQKEQIKEVLSKTPSEYGIPIAFWDVPALKEYVRAEFGVEYESDKSYHFLLKFSNLSFKYADKYDIHRDEGLIERRMKEIEEEISNYLKDPKWEVFTTDEVGLQAETLKRKAWLRQGKRTIVKVDRSSKRQNYIGMLNQKNGRCNMYEIDNGNQEEMIRTLNLLTRKYPKKKICIIWDNAAFHKGKLIRKELSSKGKLKNIHLINLPPYAPDHNPIEHVWKSAKDHTSNVKFETFEKTKEYFSNYILSRYFFYFI